MHLAQLQRQNKLAIAKRMNAPLRPLYLSDHCWRVSDVWILYSVLHRQLKVASMWEGTAETHF